MTTTLVWLRSTFEGILLIPAALSIAASDLVKVVTVEGLVTTVLLRTAPPVGASGCPR